MGFKYIKICSISVIIKEMQIKKNPLKCNFSPVRLARTSKA